MAHKTVPKYRRQKSRSGDRAFVELGGVRCYLSAFNSPESRVWTGHSRVGSVRAPPTVSVHGQRRYRFAPAVQELRVFDPQVGGRRRTMPRSSRNGSSGVGQRRGFHRWDRRIAHTLRRPHSQSTLHSPLLRPSEPKDRPTCHRNEGSGPLVTRRAGHPHPLIG